jgi:hypothetical protein
MKMQVSPARPGSLGMIKLLSEVQGFLVPKDYRRDIEMSSFLGKASEFNSLSRWERVGVV